MKRPFISIFVPNTLFNKQSPILHSLFIGLYPFPTKKQSAASLQSKPLHSPKRTIPASLHGRYHLLPLPQHAFDPYSASSVPTNPRTNHRVAAAAVVVVVFVIVAVGVAAFR